MNRVLKRVAVAGISAMLLVAGFVPLIKVHATQHGSGEYELGISVDYNADWVKSVTIDGEEWHPEDNYLSVNGTYFITAELHVPNDQVRNTTSIRPGGDSGQYTINQAEEDEDWEGTHRKFTYTINYTAKNQHDHLSLNPYSEDNGGQPGPDQQGDTEVILRVRGGEGSFDDSIYDEDHNLIQERIVNYTESYVEGSFSINGGWHAQMMPEDAVEGTNYSQINYRFNDNPNKDTVTINFATLWHMKYVDNITVNGHEYNIPIDYDDKVSYLSHYSGQIVAFDIEVPKTDNGMYDIVVKIEKNNDPYIGNFLWTGDPEQEFEKRCDDQNLDENGNPVCEFLLDEDGNKIPGHDYIGHSTLTLLEVKYTVDGIVYYCSARGGTDICSYWPEDEEENITSCNTSEENCNIPYLEFQSHSDGMVDGSLVVPAGALVTMQVIPDYGYQVMNVNMADLEVSDDGVGEFTFTVPKGAAYFVADVIPMEDKVNSTTNLVSEGIIDLGEGQTTLDHGSAQLNVSDVELDDDTITEFEGAAEGYNVKNYLEISLYNITCKGATVCEGTDEDSWIDQIRDLNEPATITLQLEDGIDGNEIVIVHQKHDGTYEVIPTIYDPETNTITFTTTSFSNYAIASRTVESPDTGAFTSDGSIGEADRILVAIMTAVIVAGTVMIVATKFLKR